MDDSLSNDCLVDKKEKYYKTEKNNFNSITNPLDDIHLNKPVYYEAQ